MKSTLWKLTALASVMGAGFLVVYQAQRNLIGKPPEQQARKEHDEFQPPPQEPASDEQRNIVSSTGDSSDSAGEDVESPPTQPAESESEPAAEPTLAWESLDDAGSYDPFGGGGKPEPPTSETPPTAERRPQPARSRFAERVASFDEPVGEEFSSTEEASPDSAPPFAGFEEETAPTEDDAAPVDSSGSVNPFASNESNDEPSEAASPFAAEPTPALTERPSTDGPPSGDDVDPFASDPAEPSHGETAAPALTRLDEESDGPSLVAPPVDATDEQEPADIAEADPAAPAPASPAGEEPVQPRADDPFGVAQISSEQPAPDVASEEPNPFPGDASPSPIPGAEDPALPSSDLSRREARTEPQPDSAPVFPDVAAASGAPEQEVPPAEESVELTIRPRSSADASQFGEEPSPQPPAQPAKAEFDPFGGPMPASPPDEEPAGSDPFGGSPAASQPPAQEDSDPDPFGGPSSGSQPKDQDAGETDPFSFGDDSEPAPLEPASLGPTPPDPASPEPVLPAARPAPDLTLPAEPVEREAEPAPVDRRIIAPPADPPDQPRPNPSNARTTPRANDPSREAEDWEGVGTIGEDSPLGTQQAQVTIEKQAPPGAVIGKPLIYRINVRNVGGSIAENVIVKDVTPKGSRLVGTSPQAELEESTNTLIWRLGKMTSGELRTIKIKVIPTDPGPIGSVATVSFEAAVAARTVITAPELKLSLQGPDEVGVGEKVTYRFTLTNAGSADASGVYIRNIIPDGFEHPRGNDLEYDVGVLRQGQSTNVDLTLLAVRPGEYQNRAVLGAEGSAVVEVAENVSVIASRLTVHREGPANRFVGRPARFVNTVTNESSNTLQGVTVVETIPAGVQVEGTSEGSVFDRQRRTVTWHLQSLEPGARRQVHISLIPTQAAEYDSTVKAFDSRGAEAAVESRLVVVGFSSLKVDVAYDGAPVPIGDHVALRLTIKNRGTAAASQVKTLVEIPPEMRFVNAKGPVHYRLVGDNLIEFETLNRLEIEGEEQFDIVLTATHKGDARVRVELQSAELSRPLNEEELVVVYANQE